MPPTPSFQISLPSPRLAPRTHREEPRHDPTELHAGEGLRVLGQPGHGLAVNVDDAPLNLAPGPALFDRFFQAFLAIHDHDGRDTVDSLHEFNPVNEALAEREAPGHDRLWRTGNEGDALVFDDGCAIEDKDARGLQHDGSYGDGGSRPGKV